MSERLLRETIRGTLREISDERPLDEKILSEIGTVVRHLETKRYHSQKVGSRYGTQEYDNGWKDGQKQAYSEAIKLLESLSGVVHRHQAYLSDD